MTKSEAYHGWTLTHRTVEEGDAVFGGHIGYPLLVLAKPGRNTISIIGRPGIDPAILEQRARVDAMQQEVDASNPDDRGLWEQRLAEAIREKEEAEAVRSLLAGMAHAREMGV